MGRGREAGWTVQGFGDGDGDGSDGVWGSLGNQKTMLFHWFFKVLEGGWATLKKKNNSFGDGLREPKLCFPLFFQCFRGLGVPGESKNNAFSLVFEGFGGGVGDTEEKK